jgi:hypothetical protein
MSSTEIFRAAVEMTRSIYDTAVIHLVAELRDAEWCNLYTSVIYGREIDLLSVPDYVDYATYNESILCLRKRLGRPLAESFVASAQTGAASCGSWAIKYAIDEDTAGFRPATVPGDLNEPSFWETSLWAHERIGTEKIFHGEPLRQSNAWKVAKYLGCLDEARWLPIPVQRHPEKLGDLDEIWPSPLSLASRNCDGGWSVEVTSIDPPLLTREIAISGSLLCNDLIIQTVHFHSSGPHKVDADVDAIDLLVTIYGVPMDAHAHRYLRSMTMRTTLYSSDRYTVPRSGARPEMQFPIGRPASGPSVIGTPRADVTRHRAWGVGRLFRDYGQPSDSERVYDPIATSDAVERAFKDLQLYGQNETPSQITVADPYALDERALDAIAVMAIRGGQVGSVRVLTAFFVAPQIASWASQAMALLKGLFLRKWRAQQTAREQAEAEAKLAAQRIATKLNVAISFYKIESLHDRFLLVGERLWHVGCSFNTIGQQISAVIEMRDERTKTMVLDIFERTMEQGPVFEARP